MLGQDPAIAKAAGSFTFLLGPCLLLDGFDQCFRRYLAAQNVVLPLMLATLIASLLTPMYLWWFIFRWASRPARGGGGACFCALPVHIHGRLAPARKCHANRPARLSTPLVPLVRLLCAG